MFSFFCALSVELMISNGHDIGSRPTNPGRGGNLGVVEIDHFCGQGISLQTNFCSTDRGSCGGIVDGPAGNGRELRAVFGIENNTLDRIGELTASYTVENYVSNGDLTGKGLTLGLGGDDAGEPVQIGGIVVFGCPLFYEGESGGFWDYLWYEGGDRCLLRFDKETDLDFRPLAQEIIARMTRVTPEAAEDFYIRTE